MLTRSSTKPEVAAGRPKDATKGSTVGRCLRLPSRVLSDGHAPKHGDDPPRWVKQAGPTPDPRFVPRFVFGESSDLKELLGSF